jgi:apolipoprotein N-acyltransferase
MMQGRTPYALLGNWVGWLCGILALVGIGRALLAARLRSGVQPQQADESEQLV